MRKRQTLVLWAALLFYLAGRFAQLYPDRLPALLIVILHVVPPAVFALVHGSILYPLRGMLIFSVFSLGIGGLCELLSLHTGFPFGHYFFTTLMGPKLLDLPLLLVLAYLGIGYLSWILSLLILGYRDQPLTGVRVLVQPLLAAFLMLAWDLAMEATWSTMDRAWIWRDGGPFFGVPVSNFFGWYLTAFLFYQGFALYARGKALPPRSRSYWRPAVLFYALCAGGNLLLLWLPMAPPMVTDGSGKQWSTVGILEACALMSTLVMAPMSLLAWLRLTEE